MKRFFVALGLALFTCFASAMCLPAADGTPVTPASTATPAIWENNSAGVAVAWYCGDGFQWVSYIYVLRWDAATPALLGALGQIAQAADKGFAIETAAAIYAKTPLTDPGLMEVLTPAIARILAARPPTPVYSVKTNLLVPTRAAYSIATGALMIDTQKRAPVGEICDCKIRFVQSGNAYCTVPSIAPDVAFCGLQK